MSALERGEAPAFVDHGGLGGLRAKLSCDRGTDDCGALVVVTPQGTVVSPWTPAIWRAGGQEIAIGGLIDGVYRTRVVGAPPKAHVAVTLGALGGEKRFELEAPEGQTLVVASELRHLAGT